MGSDGYVRRQPSGSRQALGTKGFVTSKHAGKLTNTDFPVRDSSGICTGIADECSLHCLNAAGRIELTKRTIGASHDFGS